MDTLVLDERLSMIADLVPVCDCMADIGADHGRLGLYLVKSGKCARVQMLDISDASLQKARNLMAAQDEELQQKVVFGVGDGAQALLSPADCVVIAGMGGRTIAGIIERGKERLQNSRLILQPNVDAYELRKCLMHSHFVIEQEEIARSGRRWYVAIAARYKADDKEKNNDKANDKDKTNDKEKNNDKANDKELMCGPVLLKERHPLLKEYAMYRYRIASRALEQALKGNGHGVALLQWETGLWKDVLKDYE